MPENKNVPTTLGMNRFLCTHGNKRLSEQIANLLDGSMTTHLSKSLASQSVAASCFWKPAICGWFHSTTSLSERQSINNLS